MAKEIGTNPPNELWKEGPNIRALAAILGIILVFILLAMAVAWPLGEWSRIRSAFARYTGGGFKRVEAGAPVLREKPGIQIDEHADLASYREREQKKLHSYGKTEDGAFQIPIDQAMKRVLEKGLPARKGN